MVQKSNYLLKVNHLLRDGGLQDFESIFFFYFSPTSSSLQLKDDCAVHRAEPLFPASHQRRNNPRSVNRGNEPGETLLFDA